MRSDWVLEFPNMRRLRDAPAVCSVTGGHLAPGPRSPNSPISGQSPCARQHGRLGPARRVRPDCRSAGRAGRTGSTCRRALRMRRRSSPLLRMPRARSRHLGVRCRVSTTCIPLSCAGRRWTALAGGPLSGRNDPAGPSCAAIAETCWPTAIAPECNAFAAVTEVARRTPRRWSSGSAYCSTEIRASVPWITWKTPCTDNTVYRYRYDGLPGMEAACLYLLAHRSLRAVRPNEAGLGIVRRPLRLSARPA